MNHLRQPGQAEAHTDKGSLQCNARAASPFPRPVTKGIQLLGRLYVYTSPCRIDNDPTIAVQAIEF